MFFSVKTAMKIGGKVYIPCICYNLSDVLVPTVDKLVSEGKARKYDKPVFFQNGKVLEKKAVAEEVTTKKGKKAKKEATPVVTEVEAVAVAEAEPVAETEAEGF